MSARIFTWDWRGQPEMEEIAEYVQDVSGGAVHMVAYETGTDEYAWIISDHPVSDAEARKLWQS